MELVSLEHAREFNLIYYFTGKECKRGHVSQRIVSGRKCAKCAEEDDLKVREKRLNYFSEYQKRNPEKAKAACAKYNETNRQKRREQDRVRKQNPETKAKRAAYERARRQNKRAGGGDIKKSDIDFLFSSQRGACASCFVKLDKFHVDHIMPIYLGGNSDILNLQILCPTCNMKKGKIHPQEWALKNGRLF
jgi:5-methylcytosine-specific restriction endonuclease McrA